MFEKYLNSKNCSASSLLETALFSSQSCKMSWWPIEISLLCGAILAQVAMAQDWLEAIFSVTDLILNKMYLSENPEFVYFCFLPAFCAESGSLFQESQTKDILSKHVFQRPCEYVWRKTFMLRYFDSPTTTRCQCTPHEMPACRLWCIHDHKRDEIVHLFV